jgi:hypothetical protein
MSIAIVPSLRRILGRVQGGVIPTGVADFLLALTVLIGTWANAYALPPNPNSHCMPPPGFVPGLSGPPDWISSNMWNGQPISAGSGYDWINDPRWTGAMAFSYADGSAYDVNFRAVSDGSSSSTPVTYLSWNVRVDPTSSAGAQSVNTLYFGLFPEDQTGGQPTGTGYVIQLTMSSPTTTCTGTCPLDLSTGGIAPYATPVSSSSVGANLTVNFFQEASANTWQAMTPPAWVLNNLRVSALPSGSYTWNVQLEVPTDSSTNLLPAGASKFLFWYDVELTNPAVGLIPYTWPRGSNYVDALGSGAIPDPFGSSTRWGEIQLRQLNATCPATGIALNNWMQIGTNNPPTATDPTPPSDEIRANGQNVFFAQPINNFNAPIPAGQLNVSFRIADWGSVASSTAGWTALPNLQNVATASAINPLAAINLQPPLAATNLDLTNPPSGSAQWTLACQFLPPGGTLNCPPGSGTKPLHQCMIASLAGTADFDSSSVSRNMNFTTASEFQRDAQINIAGLTPLGTPLRNVYVFLEKQNMPGFPTFANGTPEPPKPSPIPVSTRGTGTVAGRPEPGAGPTTSLDASVLPMKVLPTYLVHVYHDTGLKGTVKGVTYPILEPQSSFGYFVQHNGLLFGWEAAIKSATAGLQLTQIAPELFKFSLPDGGKMMVSTQINTVDLTTWWIWLFPLVILLIIVLLIWLIRRLVHA